MKAWLAFHLVAPRSSTLPASVFNAAGLTLHRHDQPTRPVAVLREVKHCEGTFKELRAAGAPGEGPSFADADAAAAVFGAVAPIGMRKFELSRREVV